MGTARDDRRGKTPFERMLECLLTAAFLVENPEGTPKAVEVEKTPRRIHRRANLLCFAVNIPPRSKDMRDRKFVCSLQETVGSNHSPRKINST